MTRRLLSDRQQSALILALYAAIVLLLALLYLRQSAGVAGAPLMPVDDAYIHFQYARQIAAGQPFTYNPGLPPSSGATSLLYPFVLAVGYALGFSALNLGYWAVIVGACALLASALTVRAMSRAADLPHGLSNVLGAAVAGWGMLAWHAFSGMETALVVAFTLLTFHFFERFRLLPLILSASILALLRPEASIMATIAALLYVVRTWKSVPFSRKHLLLALPIAAAAVQPLINLALTGTANASGSQAKSLLGIVPFDLPYVAARIAENYLRAWGNFLGGFDRSGVWALPPLLGIAALFGLYRLARQRPLTALLPFAWLVIIFAAIASLDTAFWHFERYHMPLLALAFPLSARAAISLTPRGRSSLIGYAFIVALFLNVIYAGLHRVNVESVAAQPLAMARWLAANTPTETLIAVHDVGLMRYLGGRQTLDLVGLTSSGMADSWRNGPGAVGEALIHAPRRPDYIAAYTTARGLSYLADSLYGTLLAGFSHEFDPVTNVALGGDFQGIYAPDWQGADAATSPRVDAVLAYIDGLTLTDTLNVAQLTSESAHAYQWRNASRFDGFASEIYLLDVPGCLSECRVLDGGRRLNGSESFTLTAQTGQDHILVSRFHAPDGGVIRIVINNVFSIERTLPAIPGQFIEIPTLIPARVVTSSLLQIRIEPVTPGALLFPYRHWLYAGSHAAADIPTPIDFQLGAIGLAVETEQSAAALAVNLNWLSRGGATGDLLAFVHLYAGLDAPPVRQSDLRPGGGALPPGAWLPGLLSDSVVLDLTGLAPGVYTLAVGLYSPISFIRLEPTVSAPYTVADSRVLIAEITIPPPD